MSFQRIEEIFFIDHIPPLNILFGDVDDNFINKDLKFLNLTRCLHELLINKGYERIIFFNNRDNIYFFDKQSLDLFTDPDNRIIYLNRYKSEQNTENQSKEKPKTSNLGSFFGQGPLDEILETSTLVINDNNINETSNNENENIIEYNDVYHYNTTSDSDAIRLLDTALSDERIKTVLIFDNFDRYTAQTYQLNGYLSKWSGFNIDTNKNKCLMIIPEKSISDLRRTNYYQEFPVINSLLRSEQALTQISRPKKDELERLMQYSRVFDRKQAKWKEVQSILLVMQSLQLSLKEWITYFQKSELETISFSSFSRLASQTDNKLKPNQFNNSGKSPSEELEEMIGMDNLKKVIQQMLNRQESPIKVRDNRRHIVFKGNPGTGKTVSARIIARTLQQAGLLSSGHLIETDGSGLIAQYVGHTREKVNDLCNRALGGVLFIDEAYSIMGNNNNSTNQNNSFAQEAVDTLLKRMEDNRDDLIVILAGYPSDMDSFLQTNPGFESRIGYTVIFEDYTPEQLFEIADKFNIKPTGLTFTPELITGIRNIFSYLYETRKKDFGNARLVEKFISSIIANHEAKYKGNDIISNAVDVSCLPKEYADFANPESSQELLQKSMQTINHMIGLQAVKQSIDNMVKSVQVNRIRNERHGQKNPIYAGHFLFKGNPGTGKTTVAREFGLILKALGMLKRGHVVEVQGEDLVAGYTGQTGGKAQEIIESALDGVLFIDEAYGLAGNPNDNSDFFKSAQNKLLTMMENYNHRLVVIAAGYPKDLDKLISSNPGFARRFNNTIFFEDYTVDELVQIITTYANDLGYKINDDALPEISGYLEYLKNESKDREFGNAGVAKNTWNKLRSLLDERIVGIGTNLVNNDLLMTITKEETSKLPMPNIYREINNPDYIENALAQSMKTINHMIGLENIKKYIQTLVNDIKFEEMREKIRKERNISENRERSFGHFLFIGNPGTGKTVIAREFAKILYSLGVIKKRNHIIEIQGEDLVAGYTGQTGEKAQEIIESAFGGILFIDEAYGLIGQENGGDFFKTAQNKLLKYMEDHKDKLIVIAAGYEHELNKLINTNPGFKSRFTHKLYFEDYSAEQLTEIVILHASSEGYEIENDAIPILNQYFCHLKQQTPNNQFGNGRVARNVWNSLKMNLNNRLASLNLDNIDSQFLMTITALDCTEMLT